MKTKHLAILLLICIVAVFVALFWRGCAPRTHQTNQTHQTHQTEPIPGKLVTAPTTPPDTVRDPALEGQVRHFRQRYEYYKGQATALQERLAALDAALADSLLSCEERQALLRAKLEVQDEGIGAAATHIEELSEALGPKRDTGSETTGAYRFAWEINHFGQLMNGGYKYKIDVLPQLCPDCPTVPPVRRRSLAALAGLGWDGRRMYAAEARLGFLKGRAELVGLAGWDGHPLGMAGLGWRW